MSTRRVRRRRARRIRAIALTCAAVLLLICAGVLFLPRMSGGGHALATPAGVAAEQTASPSPEAAAAAGEPGGTQAPTGTEDPETGNTPDDGNPESSMEPEGDLPPEWESSMEPESDIPPEPESSPWLDGPEATRSALPEAAAPAQPEPPAPTPEPLPLAGLTIGIDPGHQEKANLEMEQVAPGSSQTKYKVSGGTQGVSTRVPEYVEVLQVGLLLRGRLEELGAEVVMTRETSDVNLSNQDRARICNDAGCDLVLRLHCNGADDQSINGISLFVRATGENAAEAYNAAQAILSAMTEATGASAYGAGVYRTDTYTGLNWSVPPSILVEMGFMSNPREDEMLCDPEYQGLLAEGMARGIAVYFGQSLGDMGEEEYALPFDPDEYVE